jgi:hypothetical protein
MIVYPEAANRVPYTDVEYNKLVAKFCEICTKDMHLYMSYFEFILKTEYDKHALIDPKLIKDLRKNLIDNCLIYEEVAIFINSVFLEIISPFQYHTVGDLLSFLEEFPYKRCSDCREITV